MKKMWEKIYLLLYVYLTEHPEIQDGRRYRCNAIPKKQKYIIIDVVDREFVFCAVSTQLLSPPLATSASYPSLTYIYI